MSHRDMDIVNAPPVRSAEACNNLLLHQQEVKKALTLIAGELAVRGVNHDLSKFAHAEFQTFSEFTPKLKDIVYGSVEYEADLKLMHPALKHHYKFNRHHPEHFKEGIRGMNLVDLIEMFCDWQASTLRQKDGDLQKSIEANQERFHFSDELKQIFLNTLEIV